MHIKVKKPAHSVWSLLPHVAASPRTQTNQMKRRHDASAAASLLVVVALLVASVCHTPSAAASPQTSFSSTPGLKCDARSDCGFLPGLACMDGVCGYCQQDADCSGPGEIIRRCNPIEAQDPITEVLAPLTADTSEAAAAYCVEKDLFHPFTGSDVVATVLAFLSTALGSGCGVGGGGLLVPAYILVIGMSPKHAIPLSKATIFGNAIAIYLFNLKRKHPIKRNMPVINYDVASIMEPTTLIGSIFGVMMNHVFPNWLILVLLVSLLSYTTHKTFLKGNKIRQKETNRKQALIKKALKGKKDGGGRGRAWSIYRHFDWKIAARKWLAITRRNRRLRDLLEEDEQDFKSLPEYQPLVAPQSAVTLLDNSKPSSTKPGAVDLQATTDGSIQSDILDRLLRREADIFPFRVILPLFCAWIVVFLQALLRGGHGAPSVIGVACNSLEYWFLTATPVVVLAFITWRVGYRLRLDNRLRVVSGYPFLDSDIHWTWRNVTLFPFYCISAGIAAGLLGIGGGMVKGPIMLEMGVLPPVQSVTSSYMILYTASSTTLQFAVAGQFPGTIQYDYVAWFAFVGFLGGLCGQKVVAFLVKKYKRESIMVYILAGTIGLSTCAMSFIGLENTLHDLQAGTHMGFSSLCGNA